MARKRWWKKPQSWSEKGKRAWGRATGWPTTKSGQKRRLSRGCLGLVLAPLTLALLGGVLAGCGPQPSPTVADKGGVHIGNGRETESTAKPSTPAVPKGAGDPAQPPVRKTYSRKEIREMLKADEKGVGKKADDVKRMFGRPDSSHETKAGIVSVLVYTYKNLSVDADGSGKVDAETQIVMQIRNGLVLQDETKFIP